MKWDLVLLIATFVLALVALIGVLQNRRAIRLLVAERRRTSTLLINDDELSAPVPPPNQGPAHVIYNPTKKANWDQIRQQLARVARDASMPEPIWLETTAEDPGVSQTQAAIDAGASVVIAAGGDGTVRVVAEGLVDTGIPIGLLPLGTGNLLARNLNLPLDDTQQLARIALTGVNRKIDVGVLTVREPSVPIVSKRHREPSHVAQPGRYVFVVNAGMGLDAEIMAEAEANQTLKEHIGWVAYFKAALPHILAPKMKAKITAGRDGKPVKTEARTVMFLNCGELVGGIILDTTAKADDGWIELAVIDTKLGLIGWVDLLRRAGNQSRGQTSSEIPGVPAQAALDIHRITQASLETEDAHPVQVDGDVLGYTNRVHSQILPQALNVRVPR